MVDGEEEEDSKACVQHEVLNFVEVVLCELEDVLYKGESVIVEEPADCLDEAYDVLWLLDGAF